MSHTLALVLALKLIGYNSAGALYMVRKVRNWGVGPWVYKADRDYARRTGGSLAPLLFAVRADEVGPNV